MKKDQHSGLRQNWIQFTLLMVVNAFVGGMVGLERSIFPRFAEEQFGISSHSAILSFIVAFGISKAISNYYTGKLANVLGRKNLLIFGWILALPVPILLINAPSWNWVILANILLGIHQGLTWSSTVVMKIDLAGEKERGLAMGLNEFAGYLAVGLVAFLSGSIANRYGVTPYPFYLGILISVIGLLLSVFFVKDTRHFVEQEEVNPEKKTLKSVFTETSFTNKTLSSITQAGLVNNLNDGMIWGLLPILLFSLQFDALQIGMIAGIYPMVWGLAQLVTGRLSDLYNKKRILFWGMLLQGVGIILFPISHQFSVLILLAVALGLGTALVYPTFLSAIAEATQPSQRAESIGVFRFWRDSGYAIGAIISGITADWLGVEFAIILVGLITVGSAVFLQIRMPKVPEKECIEIEKLRQALLAKEKIQIIDLRSTGEFDRYHIPNAIHMALADIKENLQLLNKDHTIITVCGKGGGRSTLGANLCRELGYKAQWLCGGTERWEEVVG